MPKSELDLQFFLQVDHLTVLTSLFYLTIPFSYHTINQSQIHYKKHNLSNGVKYFYILHWECPSVLLHVMLYSRRVARWWTLGLFWLGIGFMVVLLRIHAFLSIFCRLKWKLGDGIWLTGWLLSRLKRSTLRPWLDGIYGLGFVVATLIMDVVWPLLLWTTWTLAKPRAMSKAPRLLLSKALLFRLPDFLLFSVSSLPLLFSHHIRCPLSNARSLFAGPFHNLLCWPNCSGLLNGLGCIHRFQSLKQSHHSCLTSERIAAPGQFGILGIASCRFISFQWLWTPNWTITSWLSRQILPIHGIQKSAM